jgi:AraC-like DNA-binding protein
MSFNWQRTIGNLRPRVDNWDGPHFQLFQCGVDYITTPVPPHPLFLDAMDPEGCWMFILNGSLQYAVGDERHRIERGQALVTRKPNAGTMLRSGSGEPLHYIWISVTGEMAFRYFDFLQMKYGQIQNLPPNNAAMRLARNIIRRVYENPSQPAHYWSELTFRWLNAWWQVAHDNRRAVSYIKLNSVHPSRLLSYAPRTMKNFAVQMGYSRAYLTRKLASQWGESPGKVLRRVRLEHAATLLRTSRLTVEEIATKVGYSTTAAFTRAFSRQYTEAPMSYRRSHVEGTKR